MKLGSVKDGLIFLGILIFVGWAIMEGTKNPEPDSPAQLEFRSKIAELVQDGLKTGTIHSVNCADGEVQINPLVWAVWDANGKKAFAELMRTHCHTSVVIIDNRSGRKLASLSFLGSYEVP